MAFVSARPYTPRRRPLAEAPPEALGRPSDPVEIAYDELCAAALAVVGSLPNEPRLGPIAARLRDAVAAMGLRVAEERNAAYERQRRAGGAS